MMATPYKQGFIAFSPDANKAAIIGPKNVVTIWDLKAQQPEATIDFPYEVGGFYSVLFAPDGHHLFTGTLG